MSDPRVIKTMYVDTESCEIKGYKSSVFTTLTPDMSNGKICWRADLTTAALKTSLAALPSKTMYCGLWMLPSGGSYTLMCQWTVLMKNIAVEPT